MVVSHQFDSGEWQYLSVKEFLPRELWFCFLHSYWSTAVGVECFCFQMSFSSELQVQFGAASQRSLGRSFPPSCRTLRLSLVADCMGCQILLISLSLVARANKLSRWTILINFCICSYHDFIWIHDSVQTMGDCYNCAVRELFSNGCLNDFICSVMWNVVF